MGWDLLVCDLDGTLVGASLDLDPGLAEGLRRARERGLRVSLATGRMPAGGDRYREELGLTDPLIFYNGALVRDHVGGQDLLSLTLPRGLLHAAWQVFAHAPVDPLFYRDDRLYCLGRTWAVRDYAERQGLEPLLEVVDDPETFLRLGAFVKALLIGHPDVLPVVRQDLIPIAGEGARLVMTQRNYLELIPAAASKGAALGVLAGHLGVPLERVVAVGDQENDLEMLEAAGCGVAMPHAPDTVRARADCVAPAPEQGGLLALLRRVDPEHFA